MPCDTELRWNRRANRRQTIKERAEEVREVVKRVEAKVASGVVKAKVGPQGAVAFEGLTDEDRDGVTDACIYRRLMATGSVLARAKIAQAEAMSGRTVNRQAIATGHHSHDGGKTWHHGH
jgi:hypothetical protein